MQPLIGIAAITLAAICMRSVLSVVKWASPCFPLAQTQEVAVIYDTSSKHQNCLMSHYIAAHFCSHSWKKKEAFFPPCLLIPFGETTASHLASRESGKKKGSGSGSETP